jgi:hypothetical protein
MRLFNRIKSAFCSHIDKSILDIYLDYPFDYSDHFSLTVVSFGKVKFKCDKCSNIFISNRKQIIKHKNSNIIELYG